MKIYQKAILPSAFKANAVASGIKRSGKLDLALFYSTLPAKAACLFTSNTIQAAPIQVNKRYLRHNADFRGIIVNSGNANCFTGKSGLGDAEGMSASAARALGVKKESILVSSTGIIGRRLPLVKVKKAIPDLVKGLSGPGINKAKVAIMTTDTFAKEVSVKFRSGGDEVTVCGIAKGAGMIAPDMATMLSFVCTDAAITRAALKKALKLAVAGSFNSITVDGCMSTNDMVILLANGASGCPRIDTGKSFNLFLKALNTVCLELAKMIVRDAEGATRFIKINVLKARTAAEAKTIALAIANSNLFKTAIHAGSPNFLGRTVASIGSTGIGVKESGLKIKISSLKMHDITLDVSVDRGKACATIYTADLTRDYIKINAEYN